MLLTYLAAILGCASLISGQNKPLQCKQYKTVSDFHIHQFTGLWYQLERIPIAYEPVGECATSRFTLRDMGHLVVRNTICQYNNSISIIGDIKQQEKGSMKHGKFSISFPVVGPATTPYWILATNYTDYAIVLSCTEKVAGQSVNGWILSRNTTLTSDQDREINEILAHNNLMRGDFKKIKHGNCCKHSIAFMSSASTIGCSLVLLIAPVLTRLF